MINVGHYDTSPFSGDGFHGAWGVYAYLPSGNILVSDIEQGMFVLTPTLTRACYLEGIVMDSVCNIPLSNVNVEIIGGTHHIEKTNFSGEYFTGTALPGTYTVTFSAPGYITKTINNVVLSNGVVTNINVEMVSNDGINFTGQTLYDNNPLPSVNVLIENTNINYSFTSDTNGDFSRCNLITDTYNYIAGKWGYVSECGVETFNSTNTNLTLEFDKGYYDDFTFNYGWTVTGTATAGMWERGKPVGTNLSGTPSNPGSDVNSDCGDKAYVTGNGGGSAGDDDVDNGTTILTSPVMDFTQYLDPIINYHRWFFNGGGSGSPNDSLIVKLDNGISIVTLEVVTASSPNNSQWVNKSFRVLDYLPLTANTRIIFETADKSPGHIVEAGVDKFYVSGSMTSILGEKDIASNFKIYPNPFYNSFYIEFKDINPTQIQIIDISGRIVFEQHNNIHSGVIHFAPELEQGVYFVKIIEGDKIIATEKLIKQ
jgi:hypothetical protein